MEPTVLSQLLPATVLAAILVWILFDQRKPDSQLRQSRARVAHAAPPPRARATHAPARVLGRNACAARKPSSSASACRTRSRAYCSSCSARSWSRLQSHGGSRASARASTRYPRVEQGDRNARRPNACGVARMAREAPRLRDRDLARIPQAAHGYAERRTMRTRSKKRSASVGSTASSGASTTTATRVNSRRANRAALGR